MKSINIGKIDRVLGNRCPFSAKRSAEIAVIGTPPSRLHLIDNFLEASTAPTNSERAIFHADDLLFHRIIMSTTVWPPISDAELREKEDESTVSRSIFGLGAV